MMIPEALAVVALFAIVAFLILWRTCIFGHWWSGAYHYGNADYLIHECTRCGYEELAEKW